MIDTAPRYLRDAACALLKAAEEMENAKRPEKAPTGYEFTGEFRQPRDGEWFWSPQESPQYGPQRWTVLPGGGSEAYWILRKLPTIESVYGAYLSELDLGKYEVVREPDGSPAFRLPDRGKCEYWLDPDRHHVFQDDSVREPRLMVRLKAETPTIESIYGKSLSELKPPEGWEFTGEFRVTHDEDWMAPSGVLYPHASSHVPVLILRPKPKPRRWVFEEVGYNIRPLKGDFAMSIHANRTVHISEAPQDYTGPYPTVLRLVERPE